MALDFQQVRQQVIEMGEQIPNRAEHFRELRQNALDTLEENATKNQYLREKVQAALTFNVNLRCALPQDEPLNHAFELPPLPDADPWSGCSRCGIRNRSG